MGSQGQITRWVLLPPVDFATVGPTLLAQHSVSASSLVTNRQTRACLASSVYSVPQRRERHTEREKKDEKHRGTTGSGVVSQEEFDQKWTLPAFPMCGQISDEPLFLVFRYFFWVLVIIPPRQAHPRVCGVPDGKRRRRVAFDATVAALDMAAGSLPFSTAEAQHLECRI